MDAAPLALTYVAAASRPSRRTVRPPLPAPVTVSEVARYISRLSRDGVIACDFRVTMIKIPGSVPRGPDICDEAVTTWCLGYGEDRSKLNSYARKAQQTNERTHDRRRKE